VPTLVLDPAPVELEELLERRRRAGADRRDEVWQGVLHMVPGPGEAHMRIQQQLAELLGPLARTAGLTPLPGVNLGTKDDYRIPDAALLDITGWGTYAPSARLVVEILSPADETEQKLPFYAQHGVEEVVIIDPAARTIRWLALSDAEYRPVERSTVINLAVDEFAARIDWPPLQDR
jgi:Uma2 family endonuclease